MTNVIVTQFCFSLKATSRPMRAEESQAAVVARQFLHVLVELFAVELASEEEKERPAGGQQRSQPPVVGDHVADEVRFENLLFDALVDQKDRTAILRLAAFQQGDFGAVEAVLVVVVLDLSASLLDGHWIGRIARLDV